MPADRRRRKHLCPYCGEITGPRPTISKMRDAAWKVFARYIKLRDARMIDGIWRCECVTCGRVMELDDTGCHAGHFLDGRRKGVLFQEVAVHCQCAQCNVFLHGNKERYVLFMVETYGLSAVREMIAQKHRDAGSWTMQELEDIADHYENLGRLRAAELGIPY